MIEWCARTVTRVSDGTNLRNTNNTGPKFYGKVGAVEVEWLADEDNGDEISYLKLIKPCLIHMLNAVGAYFLM